MIENRMLAIVLAAGNSSRMGTSKMALKWGGSTILETTLKHIKNAQVDDVLLVTGGYRDEVERLPLVEKTTRVYNPDYANGEMISSIKLALATIEKKRWMGNGVLVIPGDMPMITTTIINACIETWYRHPLNIVAPTYREQRGHPVIFPFDIFKLFETLSADKSPRHLLNAERARLHLFPMDDPAIRIDVDTPAEYAKYRPEL